MSAVGPLAAMPSAEQLRWIDRWQRAIPLVAEPFDAMAAECGLAPGALIEQLARWRDAGLISRVGPVFAPRRIGASTLAAMAVPPEQLDAVAERVNAFAQVNHNYAREHRLNLWFVVTASDQAALQQALAAISADCGLPVLDLPLVRPYHIDLGFSLADAQALSTRPVEVRHRQAADAGMQSQAPTDVMGSAAADLPLPCANERRLVAAIQHGLPLRRSPWAAIASECDLSMPRCLSTVQRWVDDGTIKRFGLVVRHHEFGFRHNAMVVWDITDPHVDAVGARMAQQQGVTLCYQRPRRLPEWPYNLFCMIHGRDRDSVRARVHAMTQELGLQERSHELLFSTQRYKQQGARYAEA